MGATDDRWPGADAAIRPCITVFGTLADGQTLGTANAEALYPYSDGPGAGEAEGLSATAIMMQAGYAAVMLGVCLLACVVPTRRALNVEPTVALRTE